MVVAAVGRGDRGEAGNRESGRRPGRRQPEGAGGRVPRGPARLPRRRPQAAGQLRVRRRRGGGDRLAAFPADRAQARDPGRAVEVHGRLHAERVAGPGRQRDHHSRGQGRHRARADLLGREVGPRPAPGHPFIQQGARGQPRVAPGAGAPDARHARRQHPRDRGIPGARPPDLRRGEGDGRRGGEADGRSDPEEAARGRALDRRRHVRRVAGAARLAADGQHRGSGRRLHRTRREDHPSAQGRRQDRSAAGARHEGVGVARPPEEAPCREGLWRHRREHDRRLRPHEHSRATPR